MTQKEIIQKIKQAGSLDIIIGLNVLLFLFSKIFMSFGWFSLKHVVLRTGFSHLFSSFWTILTYGFFHQDFVALFFNMILLFYFGRILLDYKPDKKLWTLYILGVVAGGLFFLWSYEWFPQMYLSKTSLLGASAGVMAVMTYTSLWLPHYQIKIRFLGFFKLIHILIFFLIFNLLQIPLGNPGGYFAHLGGLLAGLILFLIDKNLAQKSVVKTDVFTPKVDYKSMRKKERINTILDKISRSGYESLTQAEKDELFRQSKK